MALKPLVSIIIQTYNRSKLLAYAIESAISQSYKNIEILIGDNCSTDDTEYIVLKYKNLDNRIKYYRHNSNIGMIKNANFLLNKVHGDYFVFLNDDDWLDKNYVMESLYFLEKHPDFVLCCPSTILYDNHTVIKHRCKITRLDGNIYKRILNYYYKYYEILASSGLYRTSILHNYFCRKADYLTYRYAEDLFFQIKFLIAGKAYMINSVHYNKLYNGSTCKLETTRSDVFPVTKLTYKNLEMAKLKMLIKIILFGEFSKRNLSNKIKQNLCSFLYLKFKYKYDYNYLIRYCIHHPLFAFRKKFYLIIYSVYKNILLEFYILIIKKPK